MTNLLYVCTYNIDRSPVAEQITRAKVGKRGIHDLVVASAGLMKSSKYPPIGITYMMVEALNIKEYYAYDHTPRTVRSLGKELKLQDVVFCFEDYQVEKVLKIEPGLEGRVYTLPSFGGERCEILSPTARINTFPPLPVLKRFFYDKGDAYFGDEKGVRRVHLEIISDIERYVDIALQRMVREGLIHEPTP